MMKYIKKRVSISKNKYDGTSPTAIVRRYIHIYIGFSELFWIHFVSFSDIAPNISFAFI